MSLAFVVSYIMVRVRVYAFKDCNLTDEQCLCGRYSWD